MLRVGITGGIGTGKSTVARIFATLGIPVYYADEEARKLMNESESIRSEIIRRFGQGSYPDGKLDRAFLASQVFHDPEKLSLLNSITHPATIQHANNWMAKHDVAKVPFTLKEAALLFESGSARHLDYIIGVQAPLAIRIRRVMARDAISAEQVKQRIDRQMDESIKMKLCDVIIVNDEQHLLIPQVLTVYNTLTRPLPHIPAE